MSTRSLKKIFIYLFLTFAGLAFGFVFMYLKNKVSSQRSIASIQQNQLPGLGKHLAPLHIQLNLPERLPESDDQEVEISGSISVLQLIPGELNYEWILPEGAYIVGDENESLKGVFTGYSAKTKIVIKGFSKENRKNLALEAYAVFGENKIGNTAVISSRPEDTMESVALEKMQSKAIFDSESKFAQ